MKYDFTTIIDRRGKDALAVDIVGMFEMMPLPREGFDIIPMWTADMNFATCPTIPEAIIERAKHPLYGYFFPREEYFNAIIDWQKKRHGVTGLTREHIDYENGVIGGVISGLNVLCSRGDNILIHTPTYMGFCMSLKNNGYNMVLSELKKDEAGVYRMDFDDMEKKIVENHVHTALFCSPHNPTGRVWERWELERFMELCVKHDVYVVSDEIWSDITYPGHTHIPLQMLGEEARQRTIAVYAPSKTFNLAGLVGSYHIIYNQRLRERVDKESSLSHYNEMNVLSQYALMSAYKPEGHEWADELLQVLHENVQYGVRFIQAHFKGVDVSIPDGTYMLYLDCVKWLEAHGKTLDELLRSGFDVGVVWQDGRMFNGTTHIRMNLASPRSRIQEAFERLDKYVFNA